MQTSFISETELPGRKINLDTLQIIAHRYYWASQLVSGKEILEVGCGPGLGLGWLSRHAERIIGGDIIEENLALAKKHYGPRVALVTMDAHRLPFKNHSLDVVMCVAAIIYMDVSVLFDECHRVLRTGGTLLINTPNRDQPGFRPSRLSREYHSVPELFSLLDQHGFDARFYGAFVTGASWAGNWQSLVSRSLSAGKKVVGKTLRAFRIYSFIRRLAGSQPTDITLGAELEEQDIQLVENVHVAPLPCDSPALQHRIVYAIAQAR